MRNSLLSLLPVLSAIVLAYLYARDLLPGLNMTSGPYTLVYHAGIPGRAEPIRLLFEATGQEYEDTALTVGQEEVFKWKKGDFPGAEKQPLFYAPPVLKHGDLVISQSPNILHYLASHLPSIVLDEETDSKLPGKANLWQVQAFVLTLLDLQNEAHNTHHPIASSKFYEEQKEAALEAAKAFREVRVPLYFAHFEKSLGKAGNGYLLREGPTHADLVLFHVVDGLKFAFPKFLARILPADYPLISAHYSKVRSSPKVAAYLASERRQKFNQFGLYRDYPELDEGAEGEGGKRKKTG